jgi:hypothetical protein
VPFQANQDRRHHIPRQQHKVTNWPAYEAGLRRRGDLTLPLGEAAIAGWHAPQRTTPVGQAWYSDVAIEQVLSSNLAIQAAWQRA